MGGGGVLEIVGCERARSGHDCGRRAVERWGGDCEGPGGEVNNCYLESELECHWQSFCNLERRREANAKCIESVVIPNDPWRSAHGSKLLAADNNHYYVLKRTGARRWASWAIPGSKVNRPKSGQLARANVVMIDGCGIRKRFCYSESKNL